MEHGKRPAATPAGPPPAKRAATAPPQQAVPSPTGITVAAYASRDPRRADREREKLKQRQMAMQVPSALRAICLFCVASSSPFSPSLARALPLCPVSCCGLGPRCTCTRPNSACVCTCAGMYVQCTSSRNSLTTSLITKKGYQNSNECLI